MACSQVHEEFKQNVENISISSLIQKFTEQKGTGKERPGKAHLFLSGVKETSAMSCVLFQKQ